MLTLLIQFVSSASEDVGLQVCNHPVYCVCSTMGESEYREGVQYRGGFHDKCGPVRPQK